VSSLFSFEKYGVKIGRLWMRWPYFEPRDVWVGVYVKERFWEGGARFQRLYICPVPTIVLLFDWQL
jgi:hypothetical protein